MIGVPFPVGEAILVRNWKQTLTSVSTPAVLKVKEGAMIVDGEAKTRIRCNSSLILMLLIY